MSAPTRGSAPRGSASGYHFGWADGLLAGSLFIGTVAYLSRLPHNLSPADESVYLYQA